MSLGGEMDGEARPEGLSIPDLSQEPDERKWFNVILGAGLFAVRAHSAVYALAKVERSATELAASRVNFDVNGGLPLVVSLPEEESARHEKLWCVSEPEAKLMNIRTPGANPPQTNTSPPRRVDWNQGILFEGFGRGIMPSAYSGKLK